MKIGFSGEGFANLITLLTFAAILFYSIFYFIAYKRGINVTSRRFQFKVLTSIVFIFIIIPLWFSDLDVLWKLIATIVPLTAGLLNYFAIDKMQKFLRRTLIDKNKKN